MGKVINVQMDEDFYNKVIASSGGSGSDSGENIKYTYVDTRGFLLNQLIYFFGAVLRYEGELMGDTGIFFLPYGFLSLAGVSSMENVTAVMIDENMLVSNASTGSGLATFIEIIKQGSNSEDYLSLPRLTKEQFYSLE